MSNCPSDSSDVILCEAQKKNEACGTERGLGEMNEMRVCNNMDRGISERWRGNSVTGF